MPILKKEVDIFPEHLLENTLGYDSVWLFSLMSRREKDFMRRLFKMGIAFYGPVFEKRFRSPNGRFRTSYSPLFPSYVFVFGNEQDRYEAMKTNCVSSYIEIANAEQLVKDLRQIQAVLSSGVAVTQEEKLASGDLVYVINGPFKGFEGKVIRRESQTRLLVFVHFIEQGVSMEIDQSQLKSL
ncbi:MAG: KOW motif-containing protein [Planctomycetota bacterium]|jgi:transcription antitermination factor NusG|nr:KOW motif-containing protein [Planctomycetota bacterium]